MIWYIHVASSAKHWMIMLLMKIVGCWIEKWWWPSTCFIGWWWLTWSRRTANSEKIIENLRNFNWYFDIQNIKIMKKKLLRTECVREKKHGRSKIIHIQSRHKPIYDSNAIYPTLNQVFQRILFIVTEEQNIVNRPHFCVWLNAKIINEGISSLYFQ